MTTVLHTRQYGIFIKTNSILRRKKLHRGSFFNRDDIRTSIKFRREKES